MCSICREGHSQGTLKSPFSQISGFFVDLSSLCNDEFNWLIEHWSYISDISCCHGNGALIYCVIMETGYIQDILHCHGNRHLIYPVVMAIWLGTF